MTGAVVVTFAGSGDAFGSGGRFQTCIHVEGGGGRFLIDCGASSLIALKRLGLEPNAVDAILVSHLHGDHFGGLPFFVLDAQFSRRDRPLTVAGPPGIEARVKMAMEVLFPGSSATAQRFDLRFVELAEGRPVAVGPAEVTAFAVTHASGAPAYALRVTSAGRTIAYSGDTEWAPALVDAAADADLFICEAYYFDKRVRFHLDYATLREHRPELTCRRLALTHMSADMLARRAAASDPCAEDGLTLRL